MNIFEKIQAVRVELRHTKLKMSGKNKFANYEYMELDDFLPTLNELMNKYKMTAIASFTREKAILTAIDCETPEAKYIIESPYTKFSVSARSRLISVVTFIKQCSTSQKATA